MPLTNEHEEQQPLLNGTTHSTYTTTAQTANSKPKQSPSLQTQPTSPSKPPPLPPPSPPPPPSSTLPAHLRLLGCALSAFSAGWHDGCLGALIPFLQSHYRLTSTHLSLLFLTSSSGFLISSLLNVPFSRRLGLSRLLLLGSFVQALGSLAIASLAERAGFNLIIAGYGFIGFGLAMQDAQWNTYVASLDGKGTKLGVVHAVYGAGALVAPVAATVTMQRGIIAAPATFYASNLAWCVATLAVLVLGFGIKGDVYDNLTHRLSAPLSQDDDGSESRPPSDSEEGEGDDDEEEEGSPNSPNLSRVASLTTVITTRSVWTILLFIALYTGTESAEAGWIVSFLLHERHDSNNSSEKAAGYASAAFYTGLTTARVLLLPLTKHLTENRAVAVYVAVALATQILIWASRDLVVDFAATAACGFVMGPVYPVAVAIVTQATPRTYHPGALSLMASLGQVGSASIPVAIGALADGFGLGVLPVVLAGMFAGMLVLWRLVPITVR